MSYSHVVDIELKQKKNSFVQKTLLLKDEYLPLKFCLQKKKITYHIKFHVFKISISSAYLHFSLLMFSYNSNPQMS